MKILMVSSYLPYPLFSGGQVRLYNVIKNLADKHEITLICEKRDNQGEEDIEHLKKFCKKVITVDRKKQWSARNILKTGFSSDSFLVTGHTHSEMKNIIREELTKENFDLIHVETFYVIQNIPKTSVPIVLVEHNIEYLVYKRYSNNAPVFIRPLLYFDVEKLKQSEQKAWSRASKVVAVSPVEKKIIPRSDVEVAANGVDVEKFKIQNSKFKIQNEFTFLYIGDFKWMQNRVAAKWLIEEIWPKARSRIKDQGSKIKIKLWVVGRKIPEDIKELGSEGIIFDENAPDTVEVYNKSHALIAPIKVAGGTSFKILESMATGTIVITTDLGIEGISAKNKKEFLLANNSEDFIEQCLELVRNSELRQEIIKNARSLIEREYDWKKIVNVLESVYKSAVSG